MRKLLARWRIGVFLLFIFILSLLPRLSGLGRYITPDELIWVFRTVQFREAVLAGAWSDTLVSGHPGITTTWLGMVGINLQLWLLPDSRSAYEWITHLAFFMPDNMAAFDHLAGFLTAMRVMVAVVNSVGITAVYLIARRLWNNNTARLAVLLLALDPFVVGLSGILHVDALMATFATVALLTLLLIIDGTQRGWLTAVSGVMAALAILSKTPALLLVPIIGLVFVVTIWQAWWVGNGRVRQLFVTSLVWGTAVLVTMLAAYPALWAAPGDVLGLLSGNAGRHIEEALRPSFFLGQVTYDHGPLYYPVVLLFRLSPIVLAGLIVGVVLLWQQRRQLIGSWRKAVLLLMWVVLYIGGISFAAKKFDRYALAVIPALIILASVAWNQLAQQKSAFRRYLAPVLVGLQALYLIVFLPYPLAAYNPLAGGPWVAQQVLPLGWGEAVSAAGRWLAEQPDVSGKTAVTGIAPSLAPFFPGQTLLSSPETIGQADFVIATAGGRQGVDAEWPDLPAGFTLRHTIHYGGLDQAWIYAQTNPQKTDVFLDKLTEPVFFGNRIGLLATQAIVHDDRLDFWIEWQLRDGGENGRYTVKIKLKDAAGHQWNSREIELTNAVYFYPEFWGGGETPQVRYTLDLPPGLPSALYDVEVSLFDAAGAQLPLLASDGQFMGVAWQLAGLEIAAPMSADLAVPQRAAVSWLDGRLVLLGTGDLPGEIVTGGTAVLDLYWQAVSPLPDGLSLTLSLGETELTHVPLSRFDSGQWQPGQQIREKYSLSIPPELAGGRFPLVVQIVGEETAVSGETAISLGEIEIIATNRLFRLPDAMELSLDYHFNEAITLRGLDGAKSVVRPGEAVYLTLYWQTETQPTDLISAFVHLVGPDGGNAAQADRWPGGLPSNTWAAGEVIVDEYAILLPPDALPGEYKVAVGLYTAVDGVRLSAVDGAGTAVPDNRIILPITLTVEASNE